MQSFKKTRPTTTIFFFFLVTVLLVNLTEKVHSETATQHDQQKIQRIIQPFNVLNFGAIGDGVHDDTRAFLDAWSATCRGATGLPKMVVPGGRTFLLGPTQFVGPCSKKNVIVQISGLIVAPISPRDWRFSGDNKRWILFSDVRGLTVNGGGIIDGRGKIWWENSCNNEYHRNRPGCSSTQPASINFLRTHDSRFKDITVKNSPMFHVTLLDLNNFEMQNIRVDSPENSPNTDGLHTQNVNQVNISNSDFRSGDDCVSIGNSSSHVYIRDCHCGPGHGVSIGSLGENGHLAEVNNIHVESVNFYGTMNGIRIKTWLDGKGECHSLSFKSCNFINVLNPIIIDQYYFSKSSQESLAQRQWYFRSGLIGVQIRSILSAAIYKKQLRLSNSARMVHSAGEITNYVTVDAYRIGEFPCWFHQTWTTILQLCVAVVHTVGIATHAALVVLTVICNTPVAKLQHKFIKD
ncbi:hypothetical protein C5167_027458 [Papaver somniferum]|nr:hypothetical protein C5167_027458 [Papaver somniferum]